MDVLDFTAEEAALIAIYAADTRAATIEAITAALPYMGTELTALAKSATDRLAAMTDGDFTAAAFTADGDMDGGGWPCAPHGG
jgi:hypothetical protein